MQNVPARFLSRRLTHAGVYVINALLSPFSGNIRSATIFYTLMCSNVAHHAYTSQFAEMLALGLDDDADGLRRPISINALAASLRLPFESTRRHVHALEADGFCVRSPLGFVVPASVAAGGRIAHALVRSQAAVITEARRMVAAGVDLDATMAFGEPQVRAGAGAAPPLLEARILLDCVLRIFETWKDMGFAVADAYLLTGVLDANANHFDDGDPRPPRFAGRETPPPEDQRRPIGVPALARLLNLPPTTVRRSVAKLAKQGVLSEMDGRGWIMPLDVIDSPYILSVTHSIGANAPRLFGELHKLGRRFGDLAR